MDFGPVITVITDLIKEHSRIILLASSGLLALIALFKIFSIIKEERAQEKVYQGQMDQLEKTLNQIFSELQEIRYSIYELSSKNGSFRQKSDD